MSNDNPFSEDKIKAQLEKFEKESPSQTASIGIVVEGKDVGITGEVSRDIGKPGGWEVAAEGSWMRRTGARLAGLFKWSGK